MERSRRDQEFKDRLGQQNLKETLYPKTRAIVFNKLDTHRIRETSLRPWRGVEVLGWARKDEGGKRALSVHPGESQNPC